MIYTAALLGAGVCEVLGVVFLNQMAKSQNIKKIALFMLVAVTFGISLSLLSFAMNILPMSVAYSIWTGIGAIGAVGVGVIFNKEKIGIKKAVYLFLIVFSVIMLKLI